MPHNRFFLDAALDLSSEISLIDEEMHHFKVMRIQENETVEVVNGKNRLAKAKVLSIGKKEIQLVIQEVTENELSYPLILCQAIPRLNRLDMIVEKATELGATEIWFFPGDKSEKKVLSETQLKRFRTIAISAIKQSGRLDLPKIELKPTLCEWEPLSYPGYFGDTDLKAPLFSTLWKKEKGVFFFVGPEAGFSEKERGYLNHLLIKGVKLHPYILRTDTASLVALSLIQHWIL